MSIGTLWMRTMNGVATRKYPPGLSIEYTLRPRGRPWQVLEDLVGDYKIELPRHRLAADVETRIVVLV